MENKIEIRKEFTFSNIHIVRNCTSERCKKSAHAHTYHVEVFLTSNKLDNGQMAVDFGILKNTMKSLIKVFDGCYTLWKREKDDYKNFVKKNFKNIIETNFNPSAESYAIYFYKMIELLLSRTTFNNDEGQINVSKVIVHETHSGYAIADENSVNMHLCEEYITNISCENNEGIEVIDTLLNTHNLFINETPEQQV